MALSNREYIGRGLEVLSEGLEPHIRRVLGEVAPGLDWPEILAAKDTSSGHARKDHKRTDVQLQLRALTERLGTLGYPFALPPVAGAYASELRQVRNLWAHNEPFTDDDVARYLGTASRLLRWIVADKHAAQVDEVALEFKRSVAEARPVPEAPKPQRPVPAPRTEPQGQESRAQDGHGDADQSVPTGASVEVNDDSPTGTHHDIPTGEHRTRSRGGPELCDVLQRTPDRQPCGHHQQRAIARDAQRTQPGVGWRLLHRRLPRVGKGASQKVRKLLMESPSIVSGLRN